MKRVAVLGGGISGLSACFYLTRFVPAWHVTLFEPASLGGWLRTVSKDGFTFETGPRSLRVSDKTAAVLDIAEDVGIIDKVRLAATTNKEISIYADGKMIKLFPDPPFSRLKFLLSNPVHIRTALASLPILLRKQKIQPVTDQSISDLMHSLIRFKSLEDANFVIGTYVDAMVQGIYSGDVNTLSARSCLPFSPVFGKRNIAGFEVQKVKSLGLQATETLAKALKAKANALTFEGGLSVLVDAMVADLKKRGVEIRPEAVTKVSGVGAKGKVTSTGFEGEFDYVVSTLSSPVLSELLTDQPEVVAAIKDIKHNSLTALNLGFDELPLKGVGYLIPSREKSFISGVLFDSCQFPYIKPCVSVMIPGTNLPPPDSTVARAVEEVQRHTGLKLQPKAWHHSQALHAMPQHEVGHYKRVEVVLEKQPKWLRVGGQSLFPTGIPNCVLTSHSIVVSLTGR